MGVALVNVATRADLPTLAEPTTTACPAPSLSIRKTDSCRLTLFLALGRAFQFGEPPAQSGSQLVRSLVFGNGAYEFFETGDFLRSRLGGAISPFRINSLWGKVCWHDYSTACAFFVGTSQRSPYPPNVLLPQFPVTHFIRGRMFRNLTPSLCARCEPPTTKFLF